MSYRNQSRESPSKTQTYVANRKQYPLHREALLGIVPVLFGKKKSRLRPGDNQAHLQAAGEKLCSSTWGYDNAQISRKQLQKTDLCPLAPLKNEERDKGQSRSLSPAKLTDNFQEIRIESGKIQDSGTRIGRCRDYGGKRRDIDFFLGASLKNEVLKIMPVQKQTRAGQRTRFKVFVAIGDYNGHVGLGVKCSKEVATAIRGAIILAKLSIVPMQRGYWGNKIGKPHTVPCKVTGRCGSVLVCLIPAPRDTGIISASVPKKLLMMAGIDDGYTSARGCTATLGNFAKATFDAISKTYSYLTPDLWKETVFTKSPYQEFTDHLVKTHTRVSVQRTQAPAVATT
ncbi:40S ribosomal protein S2-like [Balaenoptera musculus]|uniref:Small ribosomal subunit protein uS5 n=1 Tax=Balaenoptera musculus TaxID=9771 RepID=A0A8B8XF54_BALMU|nr:40S ribosomal protein S2-like [Balaenoptera musculus]